MQMSYAFRFQIAKWVAGILGSDQECCPFADSQKNNSQNMFTDISAG
jgi:hypothetical protein